jgi:PAS domain S-box-containing protein
MIKAMKAANPLHLWKPIAVLCAGLILTACATYLANNDVESVIQREFTSEAKEATAKIETRLQIQQQVLQGAAALIAGMPQLDRSEWKGYAQRMQADTHLHGVQGLGFSLWLPENKLSGHIVQLRKQGFQDYTVFPAGKRLGYAPTIFIEPFKELNLRAFGYDMYSEVTRRAAMDRARDNGVATLSDKVTLLQENGKNMQPGILMYVPVYRKHASSDTLGQRRRALLGWVYSPFRMSDFLRDVLQDWKSMGGKHIQLKVYDADSADPASLLFDSDPAEYTFKPLSHQTQKIDFNGQLWTLDFNLQKGGALYQYNVLGTFVAGSLISLLISLLYRSKQSAQHNAQRIAEELTKEQQKRDEASILQNAIYNSPEFAYIATDTKGVIQIFNVGAERMLGYFAADVQNKTTTAGMSDPQEMIARAQALSIEFNTQIEPGFEARVYKARRGIEDIYEMTCIRNNGSRFPAVVSVTALRNTLNVIIGYLIIGTDNTARKRAEETLATEISHRVAIELTQNEWFRLQSTALEVCANAILIVSLEGMIQWTNPAFCDLSGYDADEVLGHNPRELVKSGAQDQAFYRDLWDTVLAGKPWKGELVNRRKNGSLYNEEMTITPVTDAKGAVTHFIVVKQNITAHKKVEQEAKAGNRAKSEFLANMSHEIRTPMNGVIGMVDILQHTSLEPAQRRMVDTIQRSAMVLLNILNDILDFSKIEAGKLSIERMPVHLRELAEGVAQLMAATANAKGIELSVFVAPALPHWIMSDPTRLRQVLLNLLGNAVKFTGKQAGNTAQVMLLVEPCILNGAAGVKLRITDNGIGISPEVLVKLFQPFTQADESTARKFGGTGLGLSISQRLVELLGGGISVQSTQGAGSEFIVELPLEVSPPLCMKIYGPNLEGVQVLTVIQDKMLAGFVSAYCVEAGASVAHFADLTSLRLHLSQLQPDAAATVALLGFEVEASVCQLGLGVSIVWLTRNAAEGIMVSAHPLLYGDLIRAIALASHRLTMVTLAKSVGALHSAPLTGQADRQLILLAEDNETNRDVIQEQLRLLGYASETAEDGVAALEMWRTGRFALLLTDCHMPHMDGFELTEAIRKAESVGTRFPIVAITANAMQGEAQRCRAQGMDDYLSKPLRTQELAPMLVKWLPHPVRLETMVQAVEDPPESLAVLDTLTLGRMVGENPQMHQRLLSKFLHNADQQISCIILSIGAGEIVKAADVAHALKSASRMVGALKLGQLCEAIETTGHAGDGPGCITHGSELNDEFALAKAEITRRLAQLAE